jgi:DNA modification methylase
MTDRHHDHRDDDSATFRNQLLIGDAAAVLRTLPDDSVDMVFTSPPYYQLRHYGIGASDGELGQEASIDQWVAALAIVVKQCARVLTPTGTLWLNVGDTYSTGPGDGAGRKSLLLGPSRLALRLTQEGLLLRNDIVWYKTNHLPHSVRDRLTPAWEHVFLFAKQPDYYFNLDAIREPHSSQPRHPTARPQNRRDSRRPGDRAGLSRHRTLGSYGLAAMNAAGRVGHPLGKNPGDVWSIGTSRYRGAHRATMPVELARRAIQAACPARRLDRTPGIVLDPFLGSGTTAVAAVDLRRDWLGIELNQSYAEQAVERIAKAAKTAKAGLRDINSSDQNDNH